MTNKVNIMTEAGADVQSISDALAHRIKAYRKQKKLTLDALSAMAGISKGMLVELEKGAANPSIAILCKVSAAMGVSVADIVDVASKPAIHIIDAADIPVLWQGEKGGSARLLAGTSGPDMIEQWRWEMLPGEQFSSPGHPQGTVELFYVEQGTLELMLDEQTFVVNPGCSAVAKTDAPHRYRNSSSQTLIFTMTVSEHHP